MSPLTKESNPRQRERGAILAFTGIVLLTLVGMTVVGVDLGRLAFTASEVQTVAEVGATGYANAWLANLASGGTCQSGSGAYSSAALEVVSGNAIDGEQADSSNIEGYECGFYNFQSGPPRFSTSIPGGESANAVRATATDTVNNYFASLFGTSESTVEKTAVATLTCGDRARPLPLAIGDCMFGGFDGPEDCADLPSLTQQNVNVDDSCWTSLHAIDSANTSDLRGYINTICGLGDSTPPPAVSIGQSVRLSEGQMTPLCTEIRDCYDAGVTEFTVPIVSCADAITCAAHGTNSLTVIGFASIEVSDRPTCTGSPKFIPINSFCNTDPTEGVGGTCDFGLYKVAMVE